MTENVLPPNHTIRALAWASFGVSILISAFEIWSETSESSGFYYAVLGPANEYAIFLLLAMYLVAIIFEVVALVIGKGWRNRVIVLAGTVALLIPIVGGVWIVGNFN
jgi:hypothetical protein